MKKDDMIMKMGIVHILDSVVGMPVSPQFLFHTIECTLREHSANILLSCTIEFTFCEYSIVMNEMARVNRTISFLLMYAAAASSINIAVR